jgi:hypothetical protein
MLHCGGAWTWSDGGVKRDSFGFTIRCVFFFLDQDFIYSHGMSVMCCDDHVYYSDDDDDDDNNNDPSYVSHPSYEFHPQPLIQSPS